MKKTYIQPSIMEVKIENTVLMAGSLGDKNNGQASEWGSRDGFFDWDWDDEEEDF